MEHGRAGLASMMESPQSDAELVDGARRFLGTPAGILRGARIEADPQGAAQAAAALDDLGSATRAAPGDGSLGRWSDTHLRLLVTAEQL
jgi:hypothetical protein